MKKLLLRMMMVYQHGSAGVLCLFLYLHKWIIFMNGYFITDITVLTKFPVLVFAFGLCAYYIYVCICILSHFVLK